ncbi:MAG: hypothetical protein M3O46_03295 [Myxococcota bacterium]|nr:hypothetical protein [Myxococcota bacterium]
MWRVVMEEFNVDLFKVAISAVIRVPPQGAFRRARTALLRRLGLRIAVTSRLAGALYITGSGSVCDLVSIGPGCHITGPLHIDLAAPVRIGANVYLGHEAMLLTVDHEVGATTQRCGRLASGPIEIGDGAARAS